tara:strand:- start:580 stop:1971 length:1392 start_codon:yes stop_codon:yes gene_type:complete
MKNFTRVGRSTGRFKTFKLVDNDGDQVQAFDLFVSGLVQEGLRPLTVETYSNHVASFLDYLAEVEVFGFPRSQLEIMTAIKAYLPARLAGSNACGKFNFISRQSLRQKKLTKASAKNHAAAINKFLYESDNHALHLQQIENWESGKQHKAQEKIFKAGERQRSSAEIKRIHQSSMLVNVMNHNPASTNGQFLRIRGKDEIENRDKDFPTEFVFPLLETATCARDEALWALQAGTGLRPSEAIQLKMDHIDFQRRTLVVDDPYNRRFASQMPDEFRRRWKGRAVSETYFIPSLRDRFFSALDRYIRREYMPRMNDGFVFQALKEDHKPYVLVSDTSRIQSFNRACKRLAKKYPELPEKIVGLTPHSLRHFYGTFMLNYVPVGNDQYGLRPVEVQRLMGHEKLATTMKYARQDKLTLEAKILIMDAIAMNEDLEAEQLLKWMADKYSSHAKRLKDLISERLIDHD